MSTQMYIFEEKTQWREAPQGFEIHYVFQKMVPSSVCLRVLETVL